MHPAIKLESLSKTYHLGENNRKALWSEWKAKLLHRQEPKLFWALRDISFEVGVGEVVGILGHNGAGKSTLLKILAQITNPSHGKVSLRGRVASLLEVGTGFHPELTGRDNIFLNGAILGMSRREIAGKMDEIVAFSGVEEFLETPVKRYSSGMRVRLAFAVAAHLDPEILFIDEVLAVGDSAFQKKCLGKISESVNAGRTVLFVSHNAAVIEALCKRGIVLHHGRMVFDGTQTEALHHYTQLMDTAAEHLRDRTDRKGTGEIRVVAVELRDSSGRAAQTVRCGEDVEFCLHFERRSPREFPTLSAHVVVSTEMGTTLFAHFNELSQTSFANLPEAGILTLRVPRLPLMAGGYKIDYHLRASRLAPDPIDSLAAAAQFSVQAGNFFGVAALPVAGLVLVNGEWRLDPASAPAPAPALA
jgi:lipopolysaccharide transport system ATP-binding protein